jgi:F-type H+-transporting ATPase subunit a
LKAAFRTMKLDPAKLAEHVQDANAFELPFGKTIELPAIYGHQITKFMFLELVAAILIVLIFVPLARKLANGNPPKGRFWNMFEAMILFIRNQVVRPAIGRHDANRFLPLILSLFFFILFCNLLGLIPSLGSPTASINVTAPLAVVVFATGVVSGMKKYGILRFWLGLCPPMELPLLLKILLVPMILVLEIVGLLIKHCILAVRLLANMFGGHLVLAMILGFIPAMAGSLLWYGVTPLAVFGGTAISMLELFVAFLQAYIFAFLAALFIGMNVHQH